MNSISHTRLLGNPSMTLYNNVFVPPYSIPTTSGTLLRFVDSWVTATAVDDLCPVEASEWQMTKKIVKSVWMRTD